ncbi:PEP-CTERM sorting domain-containing protein [Alteromonas sp. ASW11-36]|uniref:PEP-CTERM sorting domain-containing protein n=1 Tax=Alteromonas arenosi TaxID=3055817 RepID=A0ABT7SXI9_9ALTE|nr:PEP-CTERM sorting domain-containing protein [Alteromonas sp. ASW11-36]MDM7860900.1 PEP-CTERM sorting domain-containing protein [Alteromonas sp. ASW11-36]
MIKRVLLSAVFMLSLVASNANASLIYAIGDVDAVNTSGRPVNLTLLNNMLGTNQNVLMIGSWATNGRLTNLTSVWSGLSGVNVTVNAVENVTNADVAGFDFILYMQDAFNTNNSSSATYNVLNNFILGGGDFLFVSQNLGNNARSVSYNNFLAGIGSSLRTTTAPCGGTSTIASDPLTAGVSDFLISGCNQVTGGTALVTANTVAVAYERIGASSDVPEPATLGLVGLMLLAMRRIRQN